MENNNEIVEDNYSNEDMNNITQYINSLGENNVIVYIAVGSAALRLEQDDVLQTWKINQTDEQQFPKFLGTLKTINPTFPTHIILIDPALEKPPFVVCNSKKEKQEDWIENKVGDITHFHNEATNTHVYTINQNITYPHMNYDIGYVNIDNFLTTINNYAIINKWFLVFQDYSGHIVEQLAKYYDNQLNGHLNHIIYGIGSRFDGGCFIDLTSQRCQFVYSFEDNCITVFNAHNYDLLTLRQYYESCDDDSENSKIIQDQIKVRYDTFKKYIKNVIFPVVRQVGLMCFDNKKDVVIAKYHKDYFLHTHNIKIDELIDKNECYVLFENIINVIKKELISCTDYMCVEHAINSMLSDTNLYNWINYLDDLFRTI